MTTYLRKALSMFFIPALLFATGNPPGEEAKKQALTAQVANLLIDPESHYKLCDEGRGGETIGFLTTSKTITVGDLLYVEDNIWRVTTVQITTELRDSKLADAELKFYRIKGVFLFVKFVSKSKPL